MRLSEIGRPRARRSLPLHLEEPGDQRRRTRLWRVGISAGVLALLVAATLVGISLGSHMVTRAADVNGDCTLIVPNNPLSARGLATPYQLVATDKEQGPCNESNPGQSAFVQGAVLDLDTGQISIYNPLVIDRGTRPAAEMVKPQLPARAVVALWFGSNGNVLRLQGGAGGNCVNGLGDSPFGQFSYCGAPQFFAAANSMIRGGLLKVPALGTAKDGLPCPTVRDFALVDQDQSDNVTTTYLITSEGRVAQNTAANQAALAGAQTQANGSDERLLAVALDGALGCTPWMAPDLANNGALVPALPLNELQAAMRQQDPVAIVPSGDPMVLVNGNTSRAKLSLYRIGVDQSIGASGDTKRYCQNLLAIGPARMQQDMQFTMNRPSPDAAAATNLFTFLAQRFNASWTQLNCVGLLNQQSPITLQQDGNGVTIGATINLNNQGGQPTPTPTTTSLTPTPTSVSPTPTATPQPQPTPGGQGNAPDCVVNGTTIPGCTGTTIINGKTCTISYDAVNKQVQITCQQ